MLTFEGYFESLPDFSLQTISLTRRFADNACVALITGFLAIYSRRSHTVNDNTVEILRTGCQLNGLSAN